MGKQCYLCARKRTKRIALHGIPKNPITRPVWLAFCKLDESIDDVSVVHICSAHFTPDDYPEVRAKEFGSQLKLKPGAIPSILKPPKPTSSLPPLTEVIMEVEVEAEETYSSQDVSVTTPFSNNVNPSISTREENYKQILNSMHTPYQVTPKEARKYVLFAKRKVAQQAREIKSLHQRNRRLMKRIQDVNELINHLKKKES